MTEPIRAVEVEQPKPKLPRRYIWVGNQPKANSNYETSDAGTDQPTKEKQGYALYALPASDEPAKPVVSAIPTAEEILQMMCRPGTASQVAQELHALVASRVVKAYNMVVVAESIIEQLDKCTTFLYTNSGDRETLIRIVRRECGVSDAIQTTTQHTSNVPPPPDPIAAIVGILEPLMEVVVHIIVQVNYMEGVPKLCDDIRDKLTALRASLEKPA